MRRNQGLIWAMYGVIGVLLATAGVFMRDWQLYAILIAVVIIDYIPKEHRP